MKTLMRRVVAILIAASPREPMRSVPQANALPGKGLEGDRYFAGCGTFTPATPKPDYEVTLIEVENVRAFALETGIDFSAGQARRNIVTEGVRLNDLVGRDFLVGATRLRGIRLCEPCAHLAAVSHPATLRGLVHKGGLRAQILTGGIIHVGDTITPEPL